MGMLWTARCVVVVVPVVMVYVYVWMVMIMRTATLRNIMWKAVIRVV